MSVKCIPPYTPLLYCKTGVCRGIPIFLIFAPKHRLWVLAIIDILEFLLLNQFSLGAAVPMAKRLGMQCLNHSITLLLCLVWVPALHWAEGEGSELAEWLKHTGFLCQRLGVLPPPMARKICWCSNTPCL